MSPEQFIADNNGKQVDLDGFPREQPYQCYDLVNKWSLTRGYQRFSGLYAYNIYGQQPQNYIWTPRGQGVPQAGDVMVWDASKGNGAGHTAVANGVSNGSYFESLDQNWSVPRCVGVRHDYSGVIGWGRPRNLIQGVSNMITDRAHLDALFLAFLDRYPEEKEYQAYVGKLSYDSIIEALNGAEHAAWINDLKKSKEELLLLRKDRDTVLYPMIESFKVQVANQQKQIDELKKANESIVGLQNQINELTAKLATQSEDTQLLNGFGEWLSKIILRLGLKK